MDLEEHLSPQEIADRLKVDYSTVWTWIHRGKFRRVRKLGRRTVRVPVSEVNRYLREREVMPDDNEQREVKE